MLEEKLRHICSDVVCTKVYRHSELAAIGNNESIDLIISDTILVDGDVLDFLHRNTIGCARRPRIMVATDRRHYHILDLLRSIRITCAFDLASESMSAVSQAIMSILSGKFYWSQSFSEVLMQWDPLWRTLTPKERLVFMIIGDGCDDRTAAAFLQMTPASVQSVRRDIHSKLRLRHRGELIFTAAREGFVIFTPTGVVRPGISLMAGRVGRAGARS